MTLNHVRATKSVEAVESMYEQARRFFYGEGVIFIPSPPLWCWSEIRHVHEANFLNRERTESFDEDILFTLYGLLFRVYIYIGFFVPKLLNGGKTFLRDSQYYVNRI